MMEGRLSDLEDRIIDFTQFKQQRENRLEKEKNKALDQKISNIYIIGVLENREEKVGMNEHLKK